MKKLITTMMIGLAICAGTINAGNLPANYETTALAAVKSRVRDHDSVLSLASQPPMEHDDGSTSVFVLVNDPYIGIKFVAVDFRNGKILRVLELDLGATSRP